MYSTSISKDWVPTPHGRLFVKRWKPRDASGSANVPIVVFHDSLGCIQLWRQFPARLSLATGREVIAYDRLGFGRSDPCPATLGGNFISDEASGSFTALRHQLGLGHFIALGHSVGGSMAAVCAATFPDQCRALVTESAQAFVEDRTLKGIRAASRVFTQQSRLERLKKYHGNKAEWVLSAWVDTWLSESFRHWNLDDVLPLVRCPILAIHGENDEYGSLRQPERFASLATGRCATEILPDCGHMPHREKQDAVIDAVRVFLAPQQG